ncbi:transcription factor Adf-1-like [Dermacentor albipictus]|uniref:transcription factor Adf-1-like n=1 Tax=Dermacentor albipictus TaxID=60249 RepID=UPI0031FCC617
MESKAARLEFNEKLISAVQKRAILWDCSRYDYKDQRKKAQAWEEVAAEIGCDLQEKNLQARWKSLRDTFTKKYRVHKHGAPSGSGASDAKGINDASVSWPYFTLLKFLKDQAEVASTISNISQPAATETAEEVFERLYNTGGAQEEQEDEICSAPTSFVEESSVEAKTSNSDDTAALHSSSIKLVSEPPRRRRAQKANRGTWKQELDRVDAQIVANSDKGALYGQLLAEKFRSCPKRLKSQMELELLDFLKKYTFEEPQ